MVGDVQVGAETLTIAERWGRDSADITCMLGGADESALAEVRAAMARHNPEAVNDVESMIVLGRLEYQS